MSLIKRLERLEQAVGGGCRTCSGWFAVLVNGELDTRLHPPRRYGEPVDVEEYLRFRLAVATTDGRCPECGCEDPEPIRIGGPSPLDRAKGI